MKVIVMAGGEGRRLRPVSGTLPKPLVPLLGRPLLEHILLLLKEQGFRDICLTLRYEAEQIERYFGDGSTLGLQLQYRREQEALGTAGSVKNCMDFVGDEDFLVISGDTVCDFDLRPLIRRHRQEKAAASLALFRSEEPLRFGLVLSDERQQVRCFVEKPDWGRVISDLINTGIYVLSPRAMAYVPENKPYDFGKELFPLLLEKGELLLGIPLEGYWCDAGTPLSYYRCCVDALEGRLRLNAGEAFRHGKEENAPADAAEEGLNLDCPCKSRAGLMAALSGLMLEMDADYSDGIRIERPRYRLHIAPLSRRSAVRLTVQAEDAEFAKELAFSAKELVESLNL